MSLPNLVVVVVTYNSEKDIADCLKSLKEQNYPNIKKIIVVDSASSDKTLEIIQNLNYTNVEAVASEKNLYFAGGNNMGIDMAIKEYHADYVALLNPDAYAEENWISEMVKLAESDKNIGIVGAKTFFWNNPNEGLLNSCGLIFDGFMRSYDRGFMEEDKGQYNTTEEIIAVSGCNMLLKTKMVNKIGGFYTSLKMYLEDFELCLRAGKKGWKVIYTANTTVGHKYMQSTNQNISIRNEARLIENWLRIALRHYKFKSKLAMVKKYLEFKLKPKSIEEVKA